MEPRRRLIMPRSTALLMRKVPLRFTASTASQSALVHDQQQAVAGDAGVVDEDVDRAQRLLHRRDRRFGLGFLGDVGLDEGGAPGRWPARSPGRCRLRCRSDRRWRPWPPPSASRRAIAWPMPLRPTGDQRHPVLEEPPRSVPRLSSQRLPSPRSPRAPSARDSASPVDAIGRSRAIRFIRPDSTLPGPTSKRLVGRVRGLQKRLHALAEPHRGHELPGQHIGQFAGLRRTRTSVVEKNRPGTGPRSHLRQRLGESLGGAGHERRVERARPPAEARPAWRPRAAPARRPPAPPRSSPEMTTWPGEL